MRVFANHSFSRVRAKPAFTLIELLVVITIIAILASIVFGLSQGAMASQSNKQAKGEMALIAQALEQYKKSYHDYPWRDSSTNEGLVLTQALYGYDSGGNNMLREPTGSGTDVQAPPILDDAIKVDSSLGVIVDPWGNPYYYMYNNGVKGSTTWENPGYILISAGPDGVYDGSTWVSGLDLTDVDESTGAFDVQQHLDRAGNYDNLIYGYQ